jgi:transcriptional regulator with XRE-family HTH domain
MLGATITEIRSTIRWSQRELSRRTGVTQSTISRIERAILKDPPLATIAGLIDAMGGHLRIEVDPPFLGERRQQLDPAHSRMSGFVARRLETQRWSVATEVEVGGNRSRGWIDLLAFDARSRRVLVIEIKTQIHDLGRIDRTLGWYEREAWAAARRLEWRPAIVTGCLMLLMTQQNDANVRQNRESLERLFPLRARMLSTLVNGMAFATPRGARGIAMVDPRSRRRSWIRPTVLDGRRSPAPYVDYADFMRRLREQ